MEDKLTSAQIDYLASLIVDKWKQFARSCGVEEHEIKKICIDHHDSVKERAFRLLTFIHETSETGLKWSFVRKKLKESGGYKIVRKFGDKYPQLVRVVDQVDLKVEIAKRLSDWRSFGKALDICEDIISMIDTDYDTIYEKCLKVLKYHIDSKKLDFEPDWSYWKYRLYHFKEGRDCIPEVELVLKKSSLMDAVEESMEANEEKHVREIEELEIVIISHSTSKQILMFADSLKQIEKSYQDISQKNLVIHRGASSSSILTISEFISSECKEYMEKYFSGMDYFAFNDDTLPVLKGFKTHIQNNKPAFIVRNYDLYDHYKFLHLHDSLTESEMTVMDYIGFNAENKFLYFIKFSNAETLMELVRDINKSSTYLRMFALLHKNILQFTGIHLVSIIVTCDEFENLKDEVSKACQFCPKYIFTKKEFSEFSIALFLKLRCNIKVDSVCQTAFDFEDFKCSMGSLFCYMATKSGNLVPNLSKKCSTQIEQAIILYPQQVALSNSRDKRVIIQGGSGSGKTITGKLQLKQLSSDPNNKVIYYINCGTSQGFTKEMKRFVDATNQNSNVHCCSKSEFNTNSLTEMLQLIAEEHENAEIVHVILEEFPLDELNENETLSLIEFLKNSKLKDGHFKIICQTMSKERSVLRNGVEVSRTKSNQVDLLQSEADFKLAILSKSVRNTVAIFKLVNIAIEILEKESNSFTLDLIEDETVAKLQASQTKDDETKNEIKMVSEYCSMELLSELLDDDEAAKHAYLDVSANAKKQDTGLSNIPDNLDAKLKYLDKPKCQKSNDVVKRVFRFKKNDVSSHKIWGKKPVLFFTFADEDKRNNDKDKICLLTECFYQTFVKNYIPFEEPATIIHFENKPPKLLLSSLMYIKKKVSLLIYDIKNVLDVQGQEFDNVIIYIDVDEYHMRHYLVEAMSRCNANLVIIAVKEDIKNVHDSVISSIFKRYVTENVVTVFKIDDQNCVFNDLQDSYEDYLVKSSQENQITKSDVILSIGQFAANLKPTIQQFQHENKEDTRAYELNNKVVEDQQRNIELFLDHVSERIAAIWEKLGRYLNVLRCNIEAIEVDHVQYYGTTKKARAMLCCAKNSSDGLSWQRLKDGLSYCNRWDIIRDIEARQEFSTIVNGEQ